MTRLALCYLILARKSNKNSIINPKVKSVFLSVSFKLQKSTTVSVFIKLIQDFILNSIPKKTIFIVDRAN